MESGATRELRAAHAETIQELEKTRNLLSVECRISKDYKVLQTRRALANTLRTRRTLTADVHRRSSMPSG